MPISRSFVLQIVFVTGLGCLAGWGLSRRGTGNEVADGKYEFDSILERPLPVKATLDQGQRLGVMIGLSEFSQPAEYLGVLQRKYENDGLKILVVFAPNSPKSHVTLADSIGVSWVADRDGSYRRVLRSALGHGHNAVLIYDNNYRVKFQALATPDNDALRQLVEKYLLGQITYSSSKLLASHLIGRRVEGLQCLSDKPRTTGFFVVFPPGCSSCELNGYRELIERVRNKGFASSGDGDRWTLVFVNGLDGNTVTVARALGWEARSLCSVREDKLLDPYQTRRGARTVPIVLNVDDEGVVKDVQDLTTIASGGVK